jgi:sarcosine oxidase / L-pipecolate oxidase
LERSGVLVVGARDAGYVNSSYDNDLALGARLEILDSDGEVIRGIFPTGLKLGSIFESAGYLNRNGGWANASQGIRLLMSKVAALGGNFALGKTAETLIRTDAGRTSGVRCTDGSIYRADVVVLATGSWTASAFPELVLQDHCLATG